MLSSKQTHIQPSLIQNIDMKDILPEHNIQRQLEDVIDFSIAHERDKASHTERMGRPSTNV